MRNSRGQHVVWFGQVKHFSVTLGPACEQVRPPTWVFHYRIGIALDHLHRDEPSSDEFVGDTLGREEQEIQFHGTTEELLNVYRTLPDVERQEEPTAWP
jgi:hypothetical protein